MHALQAIILGIIQGLTEFIPVSSSGHLIAVPRLFGWHDMGLAFDVALHMGTLLAVIAYFRKDLASIIGGFVVHVTRRVPYGEGRAAANPSGRLMVPLLVACVPAAVVGFFWDDFIEQTLREWYWVAGALVVVAGVMVLAERAGKKRRDIDRMNYADYISIGCAQALALFPGVSRSGITISMGLFRNLDRAAAAKFSFLVSTPIILGAGTLKLNDVVSAGITLTEAVPFALGFVSAAISGYLAIRFLMRFLQTRTLVGFAIYRVCFAVFMAGVFLLKA